MLFRTTALALAAAVLVAHHPITQAADYGLDCSFPIHNMELSCGDLLGDRKAFYEDYIEGCRQHYGKKGSRCDITERDRLIMSERQPQSMVRLSTQILISLLMDVYLFLCISSSCLLHTSCITGELHRHWLQKDPCTRSRHEIDS